MTERQFDEVAEQDFDSGVQISFTQIIKRITICPVVINKFSQYDVARLNSDKLSALGSVVSDDICLKEKYKHMTASVWKQERAGKVVVMPSMASYYQTMYQLDKNTSSIRSLWFGGNDEGDHFFGRRRACSSCVIITETNILSLGTDLQSYRQWIILDAWRKS